MNLLVVGNGFDLAHELPTRYSDFLDFMVLCINKLYPNWRSIGWQFENNPYKFDKYAIDEVLTYLKSNRNIPVENLFNDCDDEFLRKSLIENQRQEFFNNQFLRYLICIYAYKKQLTNKFNWIDIEDEIEKLLMQTESLKLKFSKDFSLSVNTPYLYLDQYSYQSFHFIQLAGLIKKNDYIPEEKLKSEICSLLFQDLEQFNVLLKFYLKLIQDTFHKNEKKIFNINTEFSRTIRIDHIVSFNYTDISKIYIDNEQRYNNIHFINGELKEETKIILGIENPNSNKILEFCDNKVNLFFKDVQRILYDMRYTYNSWFNMEKEINVYIIGHSLTFSDKFILLNIIERADYVVITYYNYEDKQNKITNLYKMLGDEKFFKYVNNPAGKPYIYLKPQEQILISDE